MRAEWLAAVRLARWKGCTTPQRPGDWLTVELTVEPGDWSKARKGGRQIILGPQRLH